MSLSSAATGSSSRILAQTTVSRSSGKNALPGTVRFSARQRGRLANANHVSQNRYISLRYYSQSTASHSSAAASLPLGPDRTDFRTFASPFSDPREYLPNKTSASANTSVGSLSDTYDDASTYDAVVIGGGNAGLALVCGMMSQPTLSTTMCKILLIEGSPSLSRVRSWAPQKGAQWENRVSSLTADNVDWLREIGAWKYIDSDRSCPVNDMLVWTALDPKSTSELHFPAQNAPMAYMTENTNLQRALLKRIDELNKNSNGVKVEISEGLKVGEMVHGEGERWVGLRLGEGDQAKWVRSSVVVGADGPNSPVRRFSSIGSFGRPYPVHAIVATLSHGYSPLDSPNVTNHTAYQRFLPTGPLAFLPLSERHSTMVWSLSPPELAQAYKALGSEALRYLVNLGFYCPDESHLARINAAIIDGRLSPSDPQTVHTLKAELDAVLENIQGGDLKHLPPLIDEVEAKSVASFPLRLSHAESYISNRTVLVGDAAHTIHPLAGQGLNMGLADVRELCDVWDRAARVGGDMGSYTAMLPYASSRYSANHLLLSVTDKLHHIFGSRLPGLNWARSTGLDIINELGPIKEALMGQAGANRPRRTAGGVDRPGVGEGGFWDNTATGLEAWQRFKTVAGMVVGAGGELAKQGARTILERMSK